MSNNVHSYCNSVSLASAQPLAEMEAVIMPKSWHIFKNGRSGNYYLSYRDEQNNRKQVSLLTNNLKRAKEEASSRWEILKSTLVPDAPRTLTEFIPAYLGTMGARTASTRSSYKDSLEQFSAYIGSKELAKIGAHDGERFLSSVITIHPSGHTARRHYATLRAAFGKAYKWGWIWENPFIKVDKPRPPQTEIDHFSEQDFRSLFAVMPDNCFELRRLRNLSLLAFETGLRLGELLNLQKSAVNYTDQCLYVRNCAADPLQNISAFTTKSKQNRAVPLSQYAADKARGTRRRFPYL